MSWIKEAASRYYSECCDVPMPNYPERDICPACGEHTTGVDHETLNKESSLPKQAKIDQELKEWLRLDEIFKQVPADVHSELREKYETTLDKLMDRYNILDFKGDVGKQLYNILGRQMAEVMLERTPKKASMEKQSKIDEELRKWVELDKDTSVIQTKELDNWYQGTLDKLEDRYELTDDEGNLGEQLKVILEKQIAGELGKQATGEADQDYDKETFDKIVEQIKAAGFEASHREFDKYQGPYISVKDGDIYWLGDVYFTGDITDEDLAKSYRSVKLMDQEGNPVSWSRGDYFQTPEDTILDGYTLTLVDQKGKETIVDSPKIKDLPDITEVMTSFQYKPKTEMMHMVFSGEDNPEKEIEVVVSNGKVDASYLVDYIKEVAEKKQTKKGANMTYLIRYFDSGDWFEKEDKYETKEAADKIASDMYVCGVSSNIKIADSDGNTVASLGEFADKIALCASCREILENYKGAEDLVKAWHSVDELSHRKVIEAGLEEKVSNAIAEFSSGLKAEAAEDLKVVKEAIKEPITPLADALYYLLYWKDGKDLVKACSVMRENKMDTTDVELAGIRLGAGKMKETLTDIGVAVQDIKRVLSGFIEMGV